MRKVFNLVLQRDTNNSKSLCGLVSKTNLVHLLPSPHMSDSASSKPSGMPIPSGSKHQKRLVWLGLWLKYDVSPRDLSLIYSHSQHQVRSINTSSPSGWSLHNVTYWCFHLLQRPRTIEEHSSEACLHPPRNRTWRWELCPSLLWWDSRQARGVKIGQ